MYAVSNTYLNPYRLYKQSLELVKVYGQQKRRYSQLQDGLKMAFQARHDAIGCKLALAGSRITGVLTCSIGLCRNIVSSDEQLQVALEQLLSPL